MAPLADQLPRFGEVTSEDFDELARELVLWKLHATKLERRLRELLRPSEPDPAP
jgi:hypothetical protein